jgi:hypothetical protein
MRKMLKKIDENDLHNIEFDGVYIIVENAEMMNDLNEFYLKKKIFEIIPRTDKITCVYDHVIIHVCEQNLP